MLFVHNISPLVVLVQKRRPKANQNKGINKASNDFSILFARAVF